MYLHFKKGKDKIISVKPPSRSTHSRQIH